MVANLWGRNLILQINSKGVSFYQTGVVCIKENDQQLKPSINFPSSKMLWQLVFVMFGVSCVTLPPSTLGWMEGLAMSFRLGVTVRTKCLIEKGKLSIFIMSILDPYRDREICGPLNIPNWRANNICSLSCRFSGKWSG